MILLAGLWSELASQKKNFQFGRRTFHLRLQDSESVNHVNLLLPIINEVDHVLHIYDVSFL